MQLDGYHHLTAITADAPGNLRFHTEVLGLRLVKRTVNQDDTSAWHLFYADGRATPGTELTFFDWPAARERRGTRAVARTGLRVAEGSLEFWAARLATAGCVTGAPQQIDGRPTLDFEDPEGQRYRLTGEAGPATGTAPWAESAVPEAHQLRGLGPVTLSVPALAPTEALLTEVLGMRRARALPDPEGGPGELHVFEMGAGGPGGELHVAVEPHLPPARQGAGGVHHVAFRVPDAAALHAWTERLATLRVPSSGEVERHYFRSLYFREPGGTLFELATEGPGFTVDEPLARLGERLSLPPFLEPRRAAIEAGLKPL